MKKIFYLQCVSLSFLLLSFMYVFIYKLIFLIDLIHFDIMQIFIILVLVINIFLSIKQYFISVIISLVYSIYSIYSFSDFVGLKFYEIPKYLFDLIVDGYYQISISQLLALLLLSVVMILIKLRVYINKE